MAQVRVRFSTDVDAYRVIDTPFQVPMKLGRRGLSEVVNHLLGNTGADGQVAFDFTINEVLLRDSLRKFVSVHEMSTENVMVVKYFPSSSLSKDKSKKQELPSWVGALSFDPKAAHVYAGMYDGTYELLDASLKSAQSGGAHAAPVRAIEALAVGQRTGFATASKDHTVRMFSSDGALVKEGTAHLNSVESLAFLPSRNLLFSADWAGSLACWDASILGGDAQPNKSTTGRKNLKRASMEDWSPVWTTKAHTQSVSGIVEDPAFVGTRLITSSHDHTLKVWDIERQDCLRTVAGSRVVTALAASGVGRNVGTTHPDGMVRLWDMRVQLGGGEDEGGAANGAVSVLGTVGAWMSDISFHAEDGTKLATCDYEGAVQLWDLRSSRALDTKSVHDGKALCVEWGHDATLFSGGSDCCVKSTRLA